MKSNLEFLKNVVSKFNISEEEIVFRTNCIEYFFKRCEDYKIDSFSNIEAIKNLRQIFQEFNFEIFKIAADNIFIHPFFSKKINLNVLIDNFIEIVNFNYDIKDCELLKKKNKEIIEFLSKLNERQFKYIIKQIKDSCEEYNSFYSNHFTKRWKDNYPVELKKFEYIVDSLEK